MKKFLLVVLVGMVLAMDVYGLVEEFKKEVPVQDAIEESTMVVYEE